MICWENWEDRPVDYWKSNNNFILEVIVNIWIEKKGNK